MINIFLEASKYILILIVLFIESFPFIGALIPGGAVVVFVTGTLSRINYLNTFLAFTTCVFASLSIDIFGFYIGRKKGEYLIHKYSRYLLVKKEFIHKLAELIRRHPIKLLLFGKFNPATRSIAPFMIGMKSMSGKKFVLLSTVNSFLWISVFFGLGFIFGDGIKVATIIGKWAVIITFILFVLGYITYLIWGVIKRKRELK